MALHWDPRCSRFYMVGFCDLKELDQGENAEVGRHYVYCRKINPAYISTPVIDEESARRELRNTYISTKKCKCPVEVLLRDVLTLSFNPDNAASWVSIAREEADRIYG